MTGPSASSPVRIAQLTDLHAVDFSSMRGVDFLSKRITGWANHRLHRSGAHSMEVLTAAVDAVIEAGPDLLVVTGDVSNLGLHSELRAAGEHLARVRGAGIPVAVLPGNHDHYVPDTLDGRFERELEAFLAPEAQEGTGWPRLTRAGAVSVVLVNSAHPAPPFFAWGTVGGAQRERIDRLLASEREAGQRLLLAIHHHPDRAPARRSDVQRRLRDAGEIRALCGTHAVDLLIHGHNHHHQVRRLAGAEATVACGLGSASIARGSRPEKRAQVGLYTFGHDGLEELAFRTLQEEEGRFGPWESVQPDSITDVGTP